MAHGLLLALTIDDRGPVDEPIDAGDLGLGAGRPHASVGGRDIHYQIAFAAACAALGVAEASLPGDAELAEIHAILDALAP